MLPKLLFHVPVLGALLGFQLLYHPARWINSDNNWHFRLARDIASSVPVYWAAGDANRLFPDLLLSLAALILPGGHQFSNWLLYFYCLLISSLYLSLCFVARSMYVERAEQRIFICAVTIVLSLLFIGAPFWDNWLIMPGNHGGGLPIALVCVGLAIRMIKRVHFTWIEVALFIVLAALLIGSNRLFLVTVFGPLFGALLVLWLLPDRRPRVRVAYVMGITGVACGLGLAVWRILSNLSWQKLVAPESLPDLPADPFGWVHAHLLTVVEALALSMREAGLDVFVGVALLLMAVAAAALLLLQASSRPRRALNKDGTLLLMTSAALSAVCSLAFLVLVVDLSGAWQFRYLVVPTALAAIALSSVAVRKKPFFLLPGRITGAALLCSILALAQIAAWRNQTIFAAEAAALPSSLARIENVLRAHAPSPDLPLKGFAEYWLANKITAGSEILKVSKISTERPAYSFLNNNAADLCGDGFFFIIYNKENDDPRMSALLRDLGQPTARDDTLSIPVSWRHLATGWKGILTKVTISVLFYDPALLKSRILDPARQAAVELFPEYSCSQNPEGNASPETSEIRWGPSAERRT